MEIKFDVYFKKNLGTLFKSNEVDLDGILAHTNLDLKSVDRLEANYKVGTQKYTDSVGMVDIEKRVIQIPFKSDVVKVGLNEFEIVAYMLNGDIKTSQTYTYSIEEGIGDGKQVSGESNHTHTNLAILNTITQTKVNEWDNKADATHLHSEYASKKHTHNANEIEGLDNIDIDLSNYYTKSQTYNRDEINKKISDIVIESGNISFRDVEYNEVFTLEETTIEPTIYGNIVISATSLTVNEKETITFTVKLDKAPTNNQIVNISVNNVYCTLDKSSLTFTSSNYNIYQTVTVTGVHDDSNYNDKSSIITISSANVSSKNISVTIKNIDKKPSTTISVASVSLDKSTHNMKVDETIQLNVNILPSDATNKAITWSVSNSNAAVVNGLVTAKNVGECIITVTTEDGNKEASCSLIINAKNETIDPPNAINGALFDLDGLQGSGDTWIDNTGNGYNATIQGCIWESKGLRFGTGKKAYIPNAKSKDLINGEFTAIIQFETENEINTEQVLLARLGNGIQYCYFLINSSEQLLFNQRCGDADNRVWNTVNGSNNTIIGVATENIAILKRSNDAQGKDKTHIYIGNKLSASSSAFGSDVVEESNTFDLYIGAYNDGGRPLQGWIKRIIYFDYALSEEEIKNITDVLGGI